MTNLTDEDQSAADRLTRMLTYNLTQMIYVVTKLRVPDLLTSGPIGFEELGNEVGADPKTLYRLLRALSSQGLFREEAPGTFSLTPLSELLRSDSPASLRPYALSYGEPWWWNSWSGLLQSVRTGETAFNTIHGMGLFDYLNQDPEASAIFSANMTATTANEAQAIIQAYDFSQTHTLVDVGGGHGELALTILKAYPQVYGIVLDQPAVVTGAQARFFDANLEDRCDFIGGSFFDAIPTGGDLYALKDILHDWDDDQSIAILRNCRRSMADSARLLIIERILSDSAGPSAGKMIDITMLVLTGGRERTEMEYSSLLEAAGFRVNRVYQTEVETGIIEARPV